MTGRQARAKQYAQSVALSLLKLIPNEQPDQQQQQNAAKHRQSSKSKQSERNNIVETSGDDLAGTYQHTIFNPGAVS